MLLRITSAAAGLALLATPGAAFAANRQISINANVTASCGMGAPSQTEINLGDLTGPDGKLDPGKTGTSLLGSATIADAWCNAPHSLTIKAVPMTLTRQVAYAQPAYLARQVTYDVALTGWVAPYPITDRPHGGDDALKLGPTSGPFASSGAGLQLKVSKLQTLTAGGAEQSGLMLEYGLYRGTVTITMTPEN